MFGMQRSRPGNGAQKMTWLKMMLIGNWKKAAHSYLISNINHNLETIIKGGLNWYDGIMKDKPIPLSNVSLRMGNNN